MKKGEETMLLFRFLKNIWLVGLIKKTVSEEFLGRWSFVGIDLQQSGHNSLGVFIELLP